MTVVNYSFFGEPSFFGILSVTPSYLQLRITFTKGCKDDVELNNFLNYSISSIIPDESIDIRVLAVTPEPDVTYPTYVDLTVTDCTNGKGYELVITPSKIQSKDSEYLVAGVNEKEYLGVSELPIVLSAEPLSLTSIRVTFSKVMTINSDLLNASKYVFTGGLKTLSVTKESVSTVILTTSQQTAAQSYDLTIG
jgi:hypothetical protein